jgi:twitching motility protein PilT
MTGRVHDMILDPKLTGQLPEVIAEGSYYGMQTFDQHLLQHLHAGRVTMDDAMRVATSPHDFKLMVAASAKPGNDGPEATISAPPEQDAPAADPAAPSYEAAPAPPSPSAPSMPSAPPPGVTY